MLFRPLTPVVLAIDRLTKQVKTTGEQLMSAFSDLQAKVVELGNSLSTDLGNLNGSLQTELTAIGTALGNATSGTSDADIQKVTDSLTAFGATLDTGVKQIQDTIDAETAKLAPATPPAAPPA